VRTLLVAAIASGCSVPQLYSAFDCPAASTSAPAKITITGTVTDPYQGRGAPVANASVTSGGATAMTNAQGNFSLTLTTNGAPIIAQFELTASGYVPNAYSTADALAADTEILPVMFLDEELAMIASATGIPLGSGGVIFASVVDCMDNPVKGAQLSSTTGDIIYLDGYTPSGSATATDGDTGAAIIIGATGSDNELAATYGSGSGKQMIGNHSVDAAPDVLTQTEVGPLQ
jgi:hypothetical protein